MLLFLIFYVGIGIGIAATTLCVPLLRQSIENVGVRVGMRPAYARSIWALGTVVAWPIGLYVAWTGKLVLVHADAVPKPQLETLNAACAAFESRLAGHGVRTRVGSSERYVLNLTRRDLEEAVAAALGCGRSPPQRVSDLDPASPSAALRRRAGPRRAT